MTFKNPLFYLPLIVLMIVVSGCEAFAPFDNQQAFQPRTTNPTQAVPATLGAVVLAAEVDSDGCAVGSVTTFDRSDAIYIVLQDLAFSAGTTFFARLYKDNVALEDTRELVADQDYSLVCVNFVFKPSITAEVWATGDYGVELYVNGNSYGSVDFEIR